MRQRAHKHERKSEKRVFQEGLLGKSFAHYMEKPLQVLKPCKNNLVKAP